MRSLPDLARTLDLSVDDLLPYGHRMAKLSHPLVKRLGNAPPRGSLILVTALTPTKHGEGKTTVSIGLAQGLAKAGRRAMLALREPSMGPVFGVKGGGTGGGRATVDPSTDINLHFTGDLHAITAANNLLAAMVDNALHFNLKGAPDVRRVTWRRVLDVNDRSLRNVVLGLGGTMDGLPRQGAFDITAASEIMALLCLSTGIADLKARLARLVVGFGGPETKEAPVTAADLGAVGPMAATLRDALLPNLVQSQEGVPALLHGGPFANIAHGCNSVIATRSALALSDYVVTEAGFATELGMEKFFDLKCRASGLWPRAVVVVVTARALRHHGGDTELSATGKDVRAALQRGMVNVDRHVANVRAFGFDPVLAINVFGRDTEEELACIETLCAERGYTVGRCDGFVQGGDGAVALAEKVAAAAARPQPPRKFLYEPEAPIRAKIEAVATKMYGARDVSFSDAATRAAARFEALKLPVCIAKTPLSFSDQPAAGGNPEPFTLQVRDLSLRAGAGFLLAVTGETQTMPGLPRVPNANGIDLTEDGEIVGVH